MKRQSDGRLTVIVSIDLFGYSRLMELDESGTHQALMTCRREILEPIVFQHNGHIAKSTGDGALITFVCPADATHAMIAFQRQMASWRLKRSAPQRLVFRIGIHLGATIVEDGDLYGNDVNLAVRLQEAADPGSIALSRTVVRRLKGQSRLRFDYLGKKTLKNLKKPVAFYAVQGDRPVSAKTPDRPSRTFKWLATAAMISLGALMWSTSAKHVADGSAGQDDPSVPPPALAVAEAPRGSAAMVCVEGIESVDLSALRRSKPRRQCRHRHYALEGRVLHDRDETRVQIRLNHELVGSYDWIARLDDRSIAAGAGRDRIANRRHPPTMLDEAGLRSMQSRGEIADDVYIRAWSHYRRNTPSAFREAKNALDDVLVLDADHAEGHALLAAIYWASWQNRWQLGTGFSVVETLRRAQDHLGHVSEPTAVAHVVTSEMLTAMGHHAEAVREAERALILEPAMAIGYYAKGLALLFDGRPSDAEGLIRAAIQLDPKAPKYLFGLALAQFTSDRYQDAFVTLKQATTRNNGDDWPFLLLAASSGYLRRHDDARSSLGRFDRLSVPSRGWYATQIPFVYDWPFKYQDDRQRLRDGLVLAGIPDPGRSIGQ